LTTGEPLEQLPAEGEQRACVYRDALAQRLQAQARWRASLVERFPRDPRHSNAVKALQQAALLVRELKPDARELRPFLAFDETLQGWALGQDLEPFEVIGREGRRTSRFGFELNVSEVTPARLREALRGVHDDMLEKWRALLAAAIDAPPQHLVQHLAEHGFPLWEDEDED
jgi:hypothetical protein